MQFTRNIIKHQTMQSLDKIQPKYKKTYIMGVVVKLHNRRREAFQFWNLEISREQPWAVYW